MTLQERINQEYSKVANKLKELKEKNQAEIEELAELQKAYGYAIVSAGDKEIDAINEKIKAVKNSISNRENMIAAIDSNNPAVQEMISVEFTQWLKEIQRIEQAAKEKVKELKTVHSKLLHGLNEVHELFLQDAKWRQAINYYAPHLTEESRVKLGLQNNVSTNGPIVAMINQLLITNSTVFKRS